jgi:hypothetical protein
VYCFRNENRIALLETVNGMPALGYLRYVSYPTVQVKGKIWIADGFEYNRKPTNREWVLAKDMDRYRWYIEHYKEIYQGCLSVLRHD